MTHSRCAGLVNIRSAPILKLAKRINAVPTGGGGIRYKLTGPGGPEGGSGFDYAAYILVFPASSFCPLYKLTLSDQAQVTLQLISLSHLVQRVSTGPPLLGARKTRCWRLWIGFQVDALASMSQGEIYHYPLDRNLGRYVRHGRNIPPLAGVKLYFPARSQRHHCPSCLGLQYSGRWCRLVKVSLWQLPPTKLSYLTKEKRL